jgi:hypothetical protein
MSQFARFSEILSNPTDTPITVEVEIFGNLGARQQAVSQQQHFLITDDIIDGGFWALAGFITLSFTSETVQ